jgi:hypothetical protein
VAIVLHIAGISFFALSCAAAGALVLRSFAYGDESLLSCHTSFLAGMLTLYSAVLLGLPLSWFSATGFLVLAVATVAFLRGRIRFEKPAIHVGWTLVLVLLTLPLLSKILYTPITAWDARSIFFFHGKMIFYGNGIHSDTGFGIPANGFSHEDYPKFVSALGAMASSIFGVWNEYLPKISILMLLLGALLSIVELHHISRFSRAILLFIVCSDRDHLLSNGMMDLWVAIYSAIVVLNVIAYLSERSRRALTAALLSAGIVAGLKNEGLALVLLIALAGAVWLATQPRDAGRLSIRKLAQCYGGVFLIAALPVPLWQIHRSANGLAIDALSGEWMARVSGRLVDGSWMTIGSSLVMRTGMFWWLGAAAIASGVALLYGTRSGGPSRRWERSIASLPVAVALAYLGVLVVVFLGTTNDLAWHLDSTVHRLAYTVQALCIVALIVAVESAARPASRWMRHIPGFRKWQPTE